MSSKTLAENYLIDFMDCTTTIDDLRELRRVYKIPDDIDLRVLRIKDTPS